MREIKFRAWDGKHMWRVNKMLMGAHGGEPFQVQGIRFWGQNGSELESMNICNDECDLKVTHPHCVLEQFTGLKDKHGKEIYEGDIVLYSEHFAEKGKLIKLWVVWDSFNCQYRGHYNENQGHLLTNNRSESIEVIGNIHEHPELLKSA